MTTRLSQSVEAIVDPGELEAVLWGACFDECASCGEDAVRAIAAAVATGTSTELEMNGPAARQAAVVLVASAAFVKTLATVYATFVLRESRAPSATEAVREARKLDAEPVAHAYPLARAFLASRTSC